MKKIWILGIVLVVVGAVILKPKESPTEPITYYQYITNFEVTRFDEIIWFWTYDSLYGPVRSNDYIGIKYRPHFFDHVYTSKETFLYDEPNPEFRFEPHFNCPEFPF